MWGSLATFSSTVWPSASTALSMAFMVAPTETVSKKTWAPVSGWPETSIMPYSTESWAPRAQKAFRCWSMGRGPRLQPPGMATLPQPKRPSSAPKK